MIKDTFNKPLAGATASAFMQWLSYEVNHNPFELRICVGNDGSEQAAELTPSVMTGICMMGSRVSNAGEASPEAMAWSAASEYYEFDGAVLVAADGLYLYSPSGEVEGGAVDTIRAKAAKINFVGEFYECDETDVVKRFKLMG